MQSTVYITSVQRQPTNAQSSTVSNLHHTSGISSTNVIIINKKQSVQKHSTRRSLHIRRAVGARKQQPLSAAAERMTEGEVEVEEEKEVVVVVFDFDRTLIDGDSDRSVVTEMGLSDVFNQLRPTLSWNSLMRWRWDGRVEIQNLDKMMEELHTQGKSAEDIAECLRRTPLHPKVIAAINSVHARGCELIIISDANKFFIETILEHHDLLRCFSQIFTNPGFVDGNGRLRIFPYHDLSSPHGCDLCSPNMCKGLILNQIRTNEARRFIYLGDGSGDYCPSLKLGESDYVMPRTDYPLWKHIQSNPSLVKAKLRQWSDGAKLSTILLDIIDTISGKEIRKKSGSP